MFKRLAALFLVTVIVFQFRLALSPVAWAANCDLKTSDSTQAIPRYQTDTNLKDPTCAYQSLGSLIGLLITLALFAGALTALFFIVFAAIQWITAKSGDGAAKARSTMIYAVVGLIGLAMVYVFMLFYNNLIPKL